MSCPRQAARIGSCTSKEGRNECSLILPNNANLLCSGWCYDEVDCLGRSKVVCDECSRLTYSDDRPVLAPLLNFPRLPMAGALCLMTALSILASTSDGQADSDSNQTSVTGIAFIWPTAMAILSLATATSQ